MTSDRTPIPLAAGDVESVRHALKGEAHDIAAASRQAGVVMALSAAFEEVAHRRGFRDWNGLSAHVDRGGAVHLRAPGLFAWQDVTQPLPQLPLVALMPDELRLFESVVEVMRWARQLELIATQMPEQSRAEMVSLIGERYPYVLDCDPGRWGDNLFHLCDRGYNAYKGFTLTRDQVQDLGMRDWNRAHGSHDGMLSFTVIGERQSRAKDSALLQRMARLLAHMAIAGGSKLGQRLAQVEHPPAN